jgi:hypothetical protein
MLGVRVTPLTAIGGLLKRLLLLPTGKTSRKKGFETTTAILTIGEGNRLEVRTTTHFTDTSGRPDFESSDYFERINSS